MPLPQVVSFDLRPSAGGAGGAGGAGELPAPSAGSVTHVTGDVTCVEDLRRAAEARYNASYAH